MLCKSGLSIGNHYLKSYQWAAARSHTIKQKTPIHLQAYGKGEAYKKPVFLEGVCLAKKVLA